MMNQNEEFGIEGTVVREIVESIKPSKYRSKSKQWRDGYGK